MAYSDIGSKLTKTTDTYTNYQGNSDSTLFKSINVTTRYTLPTITDLDAINTSIKNIIFTERGELPGLPQFGSKIKDFLFEIADLSLSFLIKKEIEYVLSEWETRINLTDVTVDLDLDYNRVNIRVEYSIKKEVHDDYSSKFVVFTVNRG